MQRQEMLAQLQDTLQEPSGSLGSPATFRLSYLLNQATDDIAGKYKCWYGTASGNIVVNQVAYPAVTVVGETTGVAIIEIEAVSVYDSSGNLHTLPVLTVQGMDAEFGGWRVWVAASCPSYAVTTAMGSSFLLTAAPNYASNFDPLGITPGGYTVEGLAIPGNSWNAQTAECPLPTIVHSAIVLQACLARIIQRPTPDNLARRPLIMEALQSQLDTFESSVMRFTQATRVPSYTTGGNAGANPGFGFNPLDQ